MPADLEQRLREAAPTPTRVLDLDAIIADGLRARRRRTMRRVIGGGATGLAAVLGIVVAISVGGSPLVDIDGAVLSPSGPVGGGDDGGGGGDDTTGPDAPVDMPPGPDVDDADGPDELTDDAPRPEDASVADRLAEFDADVDVATAITPYDTASAVDSVVLQSLLYLPYQVAQARCIEGLGVTDEFPPSLPDRDAVAGSFRLDFPDLDHLRRGGLRMEISDDLEVSSAYARARTTCDRQVRPPAGHHRVAEEIHDEVVTAWQEQLAQVDDSPEVLEAGERFSACLVAEGVPADQAVDELSFLGSLDGITMRHEGTEEELEELYAHRGRLYAECGQDLFATREQLRSERRPAFLDEHRDAIEQLERWKAETFG